MKHFWVASARGADFTRLKKLGFLIFYPAMDDYVFLEESDHNKKWLSRQEDLHVRFLRDRHGKSYQTVTEAELGKMGRTVENALVEGAEIEVVDGYCQYLDGVIRERVGQHVKCELRGFKKIFHVDLEVGQVVLRNR